MLNALGQPAFIIDYRDEYGRRKQKRTDACTLKDAQRIERSILTEIDKAGALGVSRQALTPLTFAEFAEKTYFPTIKAEVRESTYRRYDDIYLHVRPYFGAMRLSSIDNKAVFKYMEQTAKEKTRRGQLPSRQELVHRKNLVGAVLKMALRQGLVTSNPVDAVELKESKDERKRKREKLHVLSQDDERRMLEKAPAWLKPLILMGLYGGMREMEIALLKWEDVGEETIYIPDSKTGNPRNVPLNAMLRSVLGAQTRHIEGGRAIPYVFWNAPAKSTYKGTRISERFSKIARGLEIPATFHGTRHTFITRARMAGVKDVQVMAIVGHADSRMLSRYTHVQEQDLVGTTETLCRKHAESVQNAAAAE